MKENTEIFMQEAILLARRAAQEDEVPVGAVIVKDGRIIGRGYNQREQSNDPTAHAETLAVKDAAEFLGSWRLVDCDLYVTLEPCPMCLGAGINSRLRKIYFGAFDPKSGACGSVLDFSSHPVLNHSIEVEGGMLAEECGELLKDFFAGKRK